MYHIDGDFGRVRFAQELLPHRVLETLFSYGAAGWHSCNELYRIDRAQGGYGYLLLFTLQGEGQMRLRGKEYRLLPGSIALLPQHWANSYRTAPGKHWEFYWIHPQGEAAMRMLDEVLEGGSLLADAGAEACAELFEELMRISREKLPGYPWEISARVAALLHRAGAALQRDAGTQRGFAEQVAAYLEQRYEQSLPLQQVAAAFFVSESHLIRRFRAEVGLTPHEYLLRYRVEQAKRLLQYTNRTVAGIAQQTGFGSSSHFVSSFRRICGVTPAAWRKKPEKAPHPEEKTE